MFISAQLFSIPHVTVKREADPEESQGGVMKSQSSRAEETAAFLLQAVVKLRTMLHHVQVSVPYRVGYAYVHQGPEIDGLHARRWRLGEHRGMDRLRGPYVPRPQARGQQQQARCVRTAGARGPVRMHFPVQR